MPDQPRSDITSSERRSFDRLVNFTDAVVAIGITLQLLPIIDVAGPKSGESVWDVVAANSGQLFAFVLSFVVVIFMWGSAQSGFQHYAVLRRNDLPPQRRLVASHRLPAMADGHVRRSGERCCGRTRRPGPVVLVDLGRNQRG